MKTQRIAIVLLATILVSAATTRAEDPVHFPDLALKAAVIEALGLMTDPTPSDMLKLYAMMNASDRRIANLTGLEYAKNLAQVNLGGNQVKDISVLAGLSHLREVVLSWNQITDVSALARLTDLTLLDLTENQITDLSPLAGLTKLRFLYLTDNQIGGLTPLAGLTNIEELSVAGTSISDLSPLAALTQLSQLNTNGNSIRDIGPLGGLTRLTVLGLRDNLVTDIRPLSKLTNLIMLDLHAASEPNVNQVADISPLAGMINMTNLTLAGNPIRDIHVLANMTQLEILDLDRTGVVDIKALAGLTHLWRLFLNLNQISDLRPLAGLTNLLHLALEHNRIVDIRPVAGLTNLTYLDLGNLGPGANQITDISPLAGLAKMQSLGLRWNLIQDISALAGLTDLHDLSLEGNPLDAKACAIYIPAIKLNNPGINLSYDACLGRVYTLTVSSTPGGSVTKPGEGAFICNDGESVPIQAVAKEKYVFTRWTGTAVNAGKVAKPDSASTSVVVNGDYTLVANFALNAVVEDFEKGKLGTGWSSQLPKPWYVTSEDAHSGKYCARAGAIDDLESTRLILRATVTAGQISFWRKVSSENWADYYKFWIDGNLQETLSGEQGWKAVSFPVSAGSHTFTWEYSKDGSGASGRDTVYIDDVSIPPAP